MRNTSPTPPTSTGEMSRLKANTRASVAELQDFIQNLRGKSPQEVADSLLVTDRAVRKWITAYNARGIAGLKPKPSGRKEGNPKWDASTFRDLVKEIDKGGYWSIPKMQEWLAAHKKVAIPEQTVWYRMDQLRYSYKSARPHPTQRSREKQERFKKGGSYRIWNH